MKLAIVHKEKCKPTVCGRERITADAVDGSRGGKVHAMERLTRWKSSALLGAWQSMEVIL